MTRGPDVSTAPCAPAAIWASRNVKSLNVADPFRIGLRKRPIALYLERQTGAQVRHRHVGGQGPQVEARRLAGQVKAIRLWDIDPARGPDWRAVRNRRRAIDQHAIDNQGPALVRTSRAS